MKQRTVRGVYGLLVLACLLFLGGGAVADSHDLKQPASTWTRYGGGPANRGANRARPLTRPLEIAWTYKFKGKAWGEPLVWNDKVVLYVRPSDAQAELHLLDLATGKRRGPPLRLKTGGHVIPTLWGDRIAVRHARAAFRVYRLGRQKLTRVFEREAYGIIYHMTMVGRRVYYRDEYSHKHCSSGRDSPGYVLSHRLRTAAPMPGEKLRRVRVGVPNSSIDSNFVHDKQAVYSVHYDVEGNAFLDADVVDGYRDLPPLFLGHHGGKHPDQFAKLALCGSSLLVTLGLPLDLKGGGAANTVVLGRTGQSAKPWKVRSILDLVGAPCGIDGRWVAQVRNADGRPQLILRDVRRSPAGANLILASDEVHPELLGSRSMSMAGRMLYCGSHRVDLETLEIYEPLPIRPLGRVVPARDTLLAFTKSNELTALREIKEGDDPSEVIVPRGTQAEPQKGTVVESDGRIRRRRLSWAEGTPFSSGKPLKRAGVLLARTDEGTIAYSPSAELALEGLGYLVAREEGPGYAKLATDAIKVRALRQAERYIQAAEDGGAGKAVSAWARKRVADLRTDRARKPPTPESLDKIRDAELALRRNTTDIIWLSYMAHAAQATAASGDWALRAELLRVVLDRVPSHEGAAAAVRSAIPKGVPLPADFNPHEWLLLADAVHVDPVRRAEPNGACKAAFAFARSSWGGGILGLRSKNLLILTKDPQPAQLAACLATGELVCRTLEGLFGSGRADGPPLVLHLFPSREEYLKASGGGRTGHGGSMVDSSAGHYVPALNISRIFLPSGPDPFAQVFETYAHELVHHWLQARCPLPRSQNRRGHAVDTPGFWLVEGIAELFAEFQFDLRRGSVRMANERAPSLDAVGHAPSSLRIPWKSLLSMDQRAFGALPSKDVVPVPMRWRAGLRRPLSAVDMFYAQSTALAQYLFHHDENSRTVLLDLVRRYYEGTLRPGDTERALKMSSGAIGRAVEAYARRER